MGFFSRNKDEYDDGQVEQPVVQAAAPVAQPPQSVDGVLPPGISPQPAPDGHNLSSQTSSLASGDMAGEYIVTDPPVPPAPAAAAPAPSPDPTSASDTSGPAQPSDDTVTVLSPTGDEPADQDAPAPEHPISVSQNTEDTPADASSDISLPSESAPELPAAEENAPKNPDEHTNDASDEHKPQEESRTEDEPAPAQPSEDESPADSGNDDQGSDTPDELAEIKRQALTDLSPLVGHLDQSPEEKFHTVMMLLQSTDDQQLVKSAYEAAQAITDEKARAQALLDIVHEINYFSQKSS